MILCAFATGNMVSSASSGSSFLMRSKRDFPVGMSPESHSTSSTSVNSISLCPFLRAVSFIARTNVSSSSSHPFARGARALDFIGMSVTDLPTALRNVCLRYAGTAAFFLAASVLPLLRFFLFLSLAFSSLNCFALRTKRKQKVK